MAYEYTITLKKEATQNNNIVNPSNSPNNQLVSASTTPKQSDGTNESSTAASVKALLLTEGKRYAKYAASNVGKYAGDSAMQTKVNNGIEGISLSIGALKSPVTTAASAAFNMLKTLVDGAFDRVQEKNRTEMARARNGYTDTQSIVTSRRH